MKTTLRNVISVLCEGSGYSTGSRLLVKNINTDNRYGVFYYSAIMILSSSLYKY